MLNIIDFLIFCTSIAALISLGLTALYSLIAAILKFTKHNMIDWKTVIKYIMRLVYITIGIAAAEFTLIFIKHILFI